MLRPLQIAHRLIRIDLVNLTALLKKPPRAPTPV